MVLDGQGDMVIRALLQTGASMFAAIGFSATSSVGKKQERFGGENLKQGCSHQELTGEAWATLHIAETAEFNVLQTIQINNHAPSRVHHGLQDPSKLVQYEVVIRVTVKSVFLDKVASVFP